MKSLTRWARRALSVLTLTPFDTSTPGGRSKERYRRVALTAVCSGAARGTRFVTLLVTTPLALGYLGQERFGLWMTIGAAVALLGFADLGIGNGLLVALAEARGRGEPSAEGDRDAARKAVSSAFFMLLALGAALSVALAGCYPYVPWAKAFNVSTELASREAGPASAVLLMAAFAGLPLSVAVKTREGYQEGFVDAFWRGVGNVAALACVLAAVWARAGLPWLVLAMSGPPLAANLLNALSLFGLKRRWLAPRWSDARLPDSRRLLRLGGLFLLIQLGVAVSYESDNLVIAHVLGPGQVTQYAVPHRLFMLVPLALGLVLGPLWPAYGEARERGDSAWVRRTFRRSILLALAANATAAAVLTVFGAEVTHLWVGQGVTPSLALRLGLGAWVVLNSLSSPLAVLLNGMGAIRFQAACTLAVAALNLPLSIALVHVVGLPGAILGTIVSFVAAGLVPGALYARRSLLSL